jgi:hypothetical protein
MTFEVDIILICSSIYIVDANMYPILYIDHNGFGTSHGYNTISISIDEVF